MNTETMATRFNYFYTDLEAEYNEKMNDAKRRERQPSSSNTPDMQRQSEFATIKQWYNKELDRVNKKMAEIESLKDLPEVETGVINPFSTVNPEIERYLSEGYEIVSIINVTGDLRKKNNRKLYKFRKIENND